MTVHFSVVATNLFGFGVRVEVETFYTDSCPPGMNSCCETAFLIKWDTRGHEMPLEILDI